MHDHWINARAVGQIYLQALGKTLRVTRTHGWLLVTLFAYQALFFGASLLTAPLGIIGGFIMGLVMDALISSFLVMVETAIRGQRLTVDDFKQSFLRYFFDVMGVLFVVWIVSMVVGFAREAWLGVAVYAAMLILFNPLPELIYLAHSGTSDLFAKAYSFIRDSWIEWFIPNLLVVGALYWIYQQPWPLPGLTETLAKAVYFAFAVYVMMIFRGFLFQALHRSSRRQRLFQYKAGQGNHAA